MSMDSAEYQRNLGFWEVDSEGKHFRLVVKEFRYIWKERVGIRLYDRDRNELFAHFSVNLPDIHLGPGEFIVKSYSEHRDFWAQLKTFPLFVDTGREARLPYNFCPIWRLITHDSYSPARSRMTAPVKAEDIQFTTGTSEEVFAAVKRLSSGRESNESRANQLASSMQAHGRQLCLSLEAGHGGAAEGKEKEKMRRLKKGKDGKWSVVDPVKA